MDLKNNSLNSVYETLSKKKILTLDEVSIYTGISKSWLYKLCQQGILPHSKPNNKLIFCNREKIDAWLLSNPVIPENIEQEAINYLANKPWKGGNYEPAQ